MELLPRRVLTRSEQVELAAALALPIIKVYLATLAHNLAADYAEAGISLDASAEQVVRQQLIVQAQLDLLQTLAAGVTAVEQFNDTKE